MDIADFSSLASDYSFRNCLLVCSYSGRTNLNQKVHKVVLGRWSDKFEREFSGNGPRNDTITIRCDPKVFDTFVLYMYTTPKARYGLININNADSLFLVAAEWDMNLLKHHCEEFWLTEFTTFPKEKVLQLLNFSVANEIHGLQRRCFEYLARNMDEIPTTSLKMLNRELMTRIVLEVNIKSVDLSLCFAKLVEWAYTCNIKCQMICDMMTRAGWAEAEFNTTQLQSMKLSVAKCQKYLQAPIFPLYKYILELSLIAHRNRESAMAEQVNAQHQMNYKLSTLRKHWAEHSERIKEELQRVKHQINPVVYSEIERQLFSVGDSVAKAALYEEVSATGSPPLTNRFTTNDGVRMKDKLRDIDRYSMEETRQITFTQRRTRELESDSPLFPSNDRERLNPDASGPRVSWSDDPKSRISWSDAKGGGMPGVHNLITSLVSSNNYDFDAERSRTRSRPEADSPRKHRPYRANTETRENTIFNSKSSKNLSVDPENTYEQWRRSVERHSDIVESVVE